MKQPIKAAGCAAAAACWLASALVSAPSSAASTYAGAAVVQVSGNAPSATGDSPFASCDVSSGGFGADDVNYLNSETGARLAVNPTDPSNVIASYQQDSWFSSGARGAVTAVSHDGGSTWHGSIPHVSVCAGGTGANGGNFERAAAPQVAFASNGDAFVIAGSYNKVQDRRTAILVAKATDGGSTWTDPVQLVNEPVIGGGSVRNYAARIVADPTDPNIVHASWLRVHSAGAGVGWAAEGSFPHRQDGFFADEMFTRTTDGGRTWEPARAIFRPHTPYDPGSHEVAALADGTVVDLVVRAVANPRKGKEWELVAIRSTDRGQTWSDPATVAPFFNLPDRDPDTGGGISSGAVSLTADLTPTSPGYGNLYAVWGGTTSAPDSNRADNDIVMVTSSDGGRTWSAPVRVDRSPAGIDALLPAVAVASDGTVAVSYYDFRANTTAPGASTDVWLTHCHPGGGCNKPSEWDEAHVGGPFDIELGPTCPIGVNIGFTMGLQASGSRFLALFAQTTATDRANQYLAVVTPQQ